MLNRYSDFNGRYGFISIKSGAFHSCVLHKDGFVLSTGADSVGQCETDVWIGIREIACGAYHTVGFDGKRVFSTGSNKFGQCNVPKKTGAKQIACGSNHTVILYKNGCLRAVGDNSSGQCEVGGLKRISKIRAINDLTVAIGDAGNTYMRGNIPIYFEEKTDLVDVDDIFLCESYAIIKLISHELITVGDAPTEFKLYIERFKQNYNIKSIVCIPHALLLIQEDEKVQLFTKNATLLISIVPKVIDAVMTEVCDGEIHIYCVDEDGKIQGIKVRYDEERLWIE